MSDPLSDTAAYAAAHRRSAGAPVLTVKPTDAIRDVLAALVRRNVYSAPVVDDSKESEFIGFIDLLDILAWVLQTDGKSDKTASDESYSGDSLFEKLSKDLEYSTKPVSDIVNAAGRKDPVVPVAGNRTLREVIELFGREDEPVPRVPVIEHGVVTAILTQSDVLGHLARAGKESLGGLAKATVREVGLGLRPVVTCSADESAIGALQKMLQGEGHGPQDSVALIGQNGELLTTLSAKDLKVLTTPESWSHLDGTALHLVSASRALSEPTRAAAITVKLTDTVWHVIEKLHATKVHRLYVVDAHNAPIGVIRHADLFRAICDQDSLRVNKNVLN